MIGVRVQTRRSSKANRWAALAQRSSDVAMVLYANNAMPKIRIPCPHCHIVSRYDASFIEDAIMEQKGIECVACFLSFNVLVARTQSRPTQYALDGGTGCAPEGESTPEVLSAGEVDTHHRQ